MKNLVVFLVLANVVAIAGWIVVDAILAPGGWLSIVFGSAVIGFVAAAATHDLLRP